MLLRSGEKHNMNWSVLLSSILLITSIALLGSYPYLSVLLFVISIIIVSVNLARLAKGHYKKRM